MMERIHPCARVRIYNASSEPRLRYEGFGHYDVAGELIHDVNTHVSVINPQELGLWDGTGYPAPYPTALHVPHKELNCVICRPFADTSQAIGLGHFTPIGGTWHALRKLGLNQEIKLYQSDGTCNQLTGLVSRFDLPHNPMFAVTLNRAEPAPNHDWTQPPYTEIHFGVRAEEEWMILLPYGQGIEIWHRRGSVWRALRTEAISLSAPFHEGIPRGQRHILWIGVLRQKLVLSTDGFAHTMWTLQDTEPVDIKSGKLTVWHNAGQWMFSFWPIKMTPAVIYSPPIETGYLTRQSSGAMLLEGQIIPVTDDEGQILSAGLLIDDTETREGLSATQRSWKAQLNPYCFRQENVGVDPDTGEPVHFETWLSPQWLSAQMAQMPELEEGQEPEYEDVSGDVVAIRGEQTYAKPTAKYRVVLDNQKGQYAQLQENRRMTVALGWQKQENGELAAQIDGYLVEPSLQIAAGGLSEALVNVLDPMLRLRDEKADGRTPVFDGWKVVDVLRWILIRCGIPESEQDLEDTGMRLSWGTPEEPAWRVEPGRSWADFLQQVAQYDHQAAIFFNEEGAFCKACRFCRRKRTPEDVRAHDGTLQGVCHKEVRWILYTRAAAAPEAAAPGEILGLRRTRRSLTSEDYANYVVVCGIDAQGRPLRATAFDAASLYDPQSDRYVGWRKMDVAVVPGAVTLEAVHRLALTRLAELGTRPEYITLWTPLLPQARLGDVMRIVGGENVGAAAQLYRIEAVAHEVRRRPQEIALTRLEGRWLGAEEGY